MIMISNRVLRSKLDPNREVGQAAQGNRIAEEAYNDFHGFIRRAREAVGRGILFDMHGQVMSEQKNERQNKVFLTPFLLERIGMDCSATVPV